MNPEEVVQAYATAKSRGDIPAALAVCHPDVVFETVPFQSASIGQAEALQQFGAFLRAFPDYDVTLDDLRALDDLVVGSGTVTATMMASLVGLNPTGRRFELPFVCLWYVRAGLISQERFFFDLNQMCEQLGLSTDDAAAHFSAWRGTHEGSGSAG